MCVCIYIMLMSTLIAKSISMLIKLSVLCVCKYIILMSALLAKSITTWQVRHPLIGPGLSTIPSPKESTLPNPNPNSQCQGCYPLARIVDLHFCSETVASSADIRTTTGTLNQPNVKLAPVFDPSF